MPVGGALIIGLMARYGSERIRGHGIPEAIESILINGSRSSRKWRMLKPLSSAHLDRFRRTVRRRRSHHHDGRRVRLDDRATVPPHQHGAQDAAGGGSGGRHVGDVRRAGGGGAAGGGAVAVRVETAQPDSGGAGQRRRRPPRGAISSGSVRCFRCRRIRCSSARRDCWAACWWGLLAGGAFGAADAGGLRGGRRCSVCCPFTGCGGRRWAVWRSDWAD